MKRKTLVLVLMLLCISTLFAQYEDFDLGKYILADYSIKALRFTLNARGDYDEVNDANATDNYHQYSGNSDIELAFDFYKNKREFQRTWHADFITHLSGRSRRYDESLDKSGDYSTYLKLDLQNRHYIDKFFVGTDLFIMLSANASSYIQELYDVDPVDIDEQKSSGVRANFALPLEFGFGRIERIDDARRAIYILEDLYQHERLKRLPKEEGVLNFAEVITNILRERIFDSRISAMEKLEMVDDYLQSEGLVAKSDIRYYNHLSDMWRYGFNEARYSGSRVNLMVRPEYARRKNMSTSYDDYSVQESSLDAGVEFVNEHPESIYRQNKLELYAYGGVLNYREISDDIDICNFPNLRAGLENTVSYYPDSRTEYALRYGVDYAWVFGEYDTDMLKIYEGGHFIRAFGNYDVKYYITPRLNIDISLMLSYNWEITDNNLSVSLGSVSSRNLRISTYQEVDYQKLDAGIRFNLNYYVF